MAFLTHKNLNVLSVIFHPFSLLSPIESVILVSPNSLEKVSIFAKKSLEKVSIISHPPQI